MSWDQCEYEISNSDADSMDALLVGLQINGVSFFVASGDFGSTCKAGDGTLYPNRVSYPSDAPHAVAVGGTSMLGTGNATQGRLGGSTRAASAPVGTSRCPTIKRRLPARARALFRTSRRTRTPASSFVKAS
jgi:subtilase family serine protease